jgi:hypothetical protein
VGGGSQDILYPISQGCLRGIFRGWVIALVAAKKVLDEAMLVLGVGGWAGVLSRKHQEKWGWR